MSDVSVCAWHICLPACLPVPLSVCLPIPLSVCLSAYSSICVSVCLCVCLSIPLSVCLSVHSSVSLSVTPFCYMIGATLRMARIIPQAGDGSCLFHSMSYGLKDGSNASTLRRDICDYIKEHPETPICKTPLSDWVQWDSGLDCTDYARRMKSGWGGGIEMACMSRLKGCNVHVYESQKLGGFKRISAFDHPVRPEERTVVRVLYRGGVHYDALMKLI